MISLLLVLYFVIGLLWSTRILTKNGVTEIERLLIVIVFFPVLFMLLILAMFTDWLKAEIKNKN